MTARPQRPRWVSAATIVAYAVAAVIGLWNALSWRHTIQLVLLQVTTCGIMHYAIPTSPTMMNYSLHILTGLVVFVGAWTAVDGTVHAAFALAALASLLLAVATWLGFAHVIPRGARRVIGHPSVSHKEQAFMLATPITIAAIIGGIYALTNTDSIRLVERVTDVIRVTSIGIVCGAILVWPLLCLTPDS